MMAPTLIGRRMGVEAGRREDPLPSPLAPGSRILDAQRPRELDQMMHQLTLETLGEHGDAVAITFAPTHRDLVGGKVDVLDAQAQRLEETRARAVQHGADEPSGAGHTPKNRAYLLAREHHRHPRRPLGPHQRLEPADLGTKDLVIQKQDRGQRLILRRGEWPSLLVNTTLARAVTASRDKGRRGPRRVTGQPPAPGARL